MATGLKMLQFGVKAETVTKWAAPGTKQWCGERGEKH